VDSGEKQKPDFTIDRSKVTRGGYMDNLETLIPGIFPKVLARIDGQEIFPGVGYRERDALAENFYEAGFYYDPESEGLKFGMEYTSYLFAPLAFNLYYSTVDEESLGLNLYLPLMKSLDSGLSAIYFGVNFEFFDDFQRREVAPFVIFDFRLPRVRGRLSLRTVFEDKSIGSAIDRFGLYLNAGVKYYFDTSLFSMNLNVVSDDNNPSDTFVKIRGYDYLPPGKSGVRFRADYSTILFNVRKGLWNPNIFIEDISGHLFVDGLIADDSDSQLSAGVELHFETRLFFYLPLDLGVRYAINKGGDSSFTFIAAIPLLF
jgi:hypothetical protein